MDLMHVKPVPGRRCKDPNTCELLPEGGRNVPRNSYWLKRIERGDCVETTSQPEPTPEPTPEPMTPAPEEFEDAKATSKKPTTTKKTKKKKGGGR